MRVGKLVNGDYVTPGNARGRLVYCPRCGGLLTTFKVKGVDYFRHVQAEGCDGSRQYLKY